MPDFPIVTPDQLASVLCGLRAQRGLTQKQAGSKVGLLPKTISALESDPARSSIASLFKLLSAMEVELVLKPRSNSTVPSAGQDW